MAQMIREDVCSVMPAEYECDMHFDVYWNAIVMAMTDPTDGYWSASHLCKVGAVLLFYFHKFISFKYLYVLILLF